MIIFNTLCTCGSVWQNAEWIPGMLTRPAGHEAKAEARKREAEDEAEAQHFFRCQTR